MERKKKGDKQTEVAYEAALALGAYTPLIVQCCGGQGRVTAGAFAGFSCLGGSTVTM